MHVHGIVDEDVVLHQDVIIQILIANEIHLGSMVLTHVQLGGGQIVGIAHD